METRVSAAFAFAQRICFPEAFHKTTSRLATNPLAASTNLFHQITFALRDQILCFALLPHDNSVDQLAPRQFTTINRISPQCTFAHETSKRHLLLARVSPSPHRQSDSQTLPRLPRRIAFALSPREHYPFPLLALSVVSNFRRAMITLFPRL